MSSGKKTEVDTMKKIFTRIFIVLIKLVLIILIYGTPILGVWLAATLFTLRRPECPVPSLLREPMK